MTTRVSRMGDTRQFDRYNVIDDADLAAAVAKRLNGKQAACRARE
jgi:hypothetical protein